jgi:hypothetical protein
VHAAQRQPLPGGAAPADIDLFADPPDRPVDPNVLMPNRTPLALSTSNSIHLFALGSDDRVWRANRAQPAAAPWSSWQIADGGIRTPLWRDLQGIANADGSLELVALGPDSKLYYQKSNGAANVNWQSLDGECQRIALGRDPGGGLEVIAVCEGNAIFRIAQNGAAGAWGNWGTRIGTATQVFHSTGSAGRVGIYGVDSNGQVHHRSHGTNGTLWSDWSTLGGSVRQLAFGRNSAEATEIFAIGKDDRFLWTLQPRPIGGWGHWQQIGGPKSLRQVATVSGSNGLQTLFAIGRDMALWTIRETVTPGGWSSWTRIGQGLPDGRLSRFIVVTTADQRLMVTAICLEGRLWRIEQPGASTVWGNWSLVPMS